ncbi:MAG: hypothetical protein H7A31_02300 [Thermotogae bacterium]|nr:hypothetical protein [Thermotogota bacterium]MCP5465509.1 hypothetical protein [Thermotogota bacterium]HOO74009.1 hypothetical protein [Tepiditoga sp.]
MIYTIIAAALNAALGFMYYEKIYFFVIGILAIAVISMTFVKKDYDKLTTIILSTGLLLSFITHYKNMDFPLFLIFINISAVFSSFYFIKNKKIFSFISWIFNGFSLGYLLWNVKSPVWGIIIGVLIVLLGMKDFFRKNKVTDN